MKRTGFCGQLCANAKVARLAAITAPAETARSAMQNLVMDSLDSFVRLLGCRKLAQSLQSRKAPRAAPDVRMSHPLCDAAVRPLHASRHDGQRATDQLTKRTTPAGITAGGRLRRRQRIQATWRANPCGSTRTRISFPRSSSTG